MITEAGELLLRRGLITQDQLIQFLVSTAGTSGILESIISSGFAKERRWR